MSVALERLIQRIETCEGYGLNATDVNTIVRELRANAELTEALEDATAKLHNILHSHSKEIGMLLTGTQICLAKCRVVLDTYRKAVGK